MKFKRVANPEYVDWEHRVVDKNGVTVRIRISIPTHIVGGFFEVYVERAEGMVNKDVGWAIGFNNACAILKADNWLQSDIDREIETFINAKRKK